MTRPGLLLAAVLLWSTAAAVFSALAHITPDTQAEFGFDVCVDQGALDSGYVDVGVRWVRPLPGGWLITTTEYVEPDGQAFRRYIWNDAISESPIESIERLRFDDEAGASVARVPRELLSRSYMYYDSSEPIFDGGFFYSIDLSTFAGHDCESSG